MVARGVNKRMVTKMANFPCLVACAVSAICFGIGSGSAQNCASLPKAIATVPCNASELRPTQPSVGLAEVQDRKAKLSGKSKKHQVEYFDKRRPVVVKGPNNGFYVVDHHHLVRMAMDMKVEKPSCDIVVDLSRLGEEQFWSTLNAKCWAYLKDEKGGEISYKTLPKSVAELRDDPYRSLAWRVRKQGGFCKSSTAFAEFRWALFFRQKGIKPEDDRSALVEAKTCGANATAALPGCKSQPGEACASDKDD